MPVIKIASYFGFGGNQVPSGGGVISLGCLLNDHHPGLTPAVIKPLHSPQGKATLLAGDSPHRRTKAPATEVPDVPLPKQGEGHQPGVGSVRSQGL